MSRNLKVLGLALLAAFALSAVAASAALAHTPAKFTSGSDWTVLHAKALTILIVEEGEIEVLCKSTAVDNTSMGTEATSITAEPTVGLTTDEAGKTECEFVSAGSKFSAQVHTNGCRTVFAAGGTQDGEVHGECPEGKLVELTVSILGKWRQCLDTQPQTPTVPTVDYTNNTEVTGGKNVWDITGKSTIEGITYTKTGICGSGTFHNTKTTGEVTVWGTDTAGNPVDVTWDATKP